MFRRKQQGRTCHVIAIGDECRIIEESLQRRLALDPATRDVAPYVHTYPGFDLKDYDLRNPVSLVYVNLPDQKLTELSRSDIGAFGRKLLAHGMPPVVVNTPGRVAIRFMHELKEIYECGRVRLLPDIGLLIQTFKV